MALVCALAQTAAGDEGRAAVLRTEHLMKVCGLSRAELTAQMARLRDLGLVLQGTEENGYILASSLADMVIAEAVLPALLPHLDISRGWVVGLPYCYHERCVSTNVLLKREASTCPAGKVMVTDEQTGGRGRLGRSWWSQAGKDITFSLLLRPDIGLAQVPLLSLAAALAVAEALETLPGLAGRVQVKWPNDVLVDGRKVCGVLPESSLMGERLDWVVVGVGLNVNSDPARLTEGLSAEQRAEWKGKAEPTSLRQALGQKVPRASLLAFLLWYLDRRLSELDVDDLVAGLRTRDALLGQEIQVYDGLSEERTAVTGKAAGIGAGGELLVTEDGGRTMRVMAGEVTVRTIS